ncbi:MAG: hypothetical protein U5M23_06180, partial [Marinagarivorans sp.]|nr:hypothetical protein [Marinagarivorans sp.]
VYFVQLHVAINVSQLYFPPIGRVAAAFSTMAVTSARRAPSSGMQHANTLRAAAAVCSESLIDWTKVVFGIEMQERHEPAVDAAGFHPVATVGGRPRRAPRDSAGKALVRPETQPFGAEHQASRGALASSRPA